MATFYLKSNSGVLEFQTNFAYTLGDRMVIQVADLSTNFATARRWVWECTTAGTSAGVVPTWPGAASQDVTTVTSGGATFTARKPGFSSGTTPNWSFATIYCTYVVGAMSAGDTVYVSHQHNEAPAGANSFSLPGNGFAICVNDGAAPPTTLATTAIVSSSGEFALTTGGTNTQCYFYGINFICGIGATGTRTITARGYHEQCSFQLASTGANCLVSGNAYFKNCWVKFAAASHSVSGNLCLHWKGGGLLSGGVSPTNMFGNGPGMFIEDIDLSAANAAINLISDNTACYFSRYTNIKMPASWSGTINATSKAVEGYDETFSLGNTGSSALYRKQMYAGTVYNEATLVKTGGANDSVAALSYKMVTNTNPVFPLCTLSSPVIAVWNAVVDVPVTVTLDLLHDSLTNLKDDQFWIEASYYSESGSPLGSFVSSARAIMGTAADLAASTATWTTTGMTNPNRQKASVTFTPRLVGYIRIEAFLTKASATVYIDPKVAVTS